MYTDSKIYLFLRILLRKKTYSNRPQIPWRRDYRVIERYAFHRNETDTVVLIVTIKRERHSCSQTRHA